MTPFLRHLEMMKEIHDRKSRDYSSSEDRFVNYHRQAEIVSWFKHPQDQVYAGRIAEKLSRLATLRNKEHDANLEGRDRPDVANEPLIDSFLDCCTIFNIWWADYEGDYRPTAYGDSSEHLREEPRPGVPPAGSRHSDVKSGAVAGGDRGTSPGAERDSRDEGRPGPIPLAHREVIQFVDWLRATSLPLEELDWLLEQVRIKQGKLIRGLR